MATLRSTSLAVHLSIVSGGNPMKKLITVLLVLLVPGSAIAVQFETVINETEGWVDIILLETVQFEMNSADAAYLTFVVRAGLPGSQWFGTYPEGFSYSHNGVPESVTTGVHMPFDTSFGFVLAGDVLFVDQGHWNIFSAGDTFTLYAGTVRLPWLPTVTYLPSGDYDMFIVNDQDGTLYSDSPVISSQEVTWGTVKALFR